MHSTTQAGRRMRLLETFRQALSLFFCRSLGTHIYIYLYIYACIQSVTTNKRSAANLEATSSNQQPPIRRPTCNLRSAPMILGDMYADIFYIHQRRACMGIFGCEHTILKVCHRAAGCSHLCASAHRVVRAAAARRNLDSLPKRALALGQCIGEDFRRPPAALGPPNAEGEQDRSVSIVRAGEQSRRRS